MSRLHHGADGDSVGPLSRRRRAHRGTLIAISAASNDQAPAGFPPLRFLTEVIAWVATPWALWSVSPILAIAAVVVLIALPTVFATRGDKNQVMVPVPGIVTIGILALTLAAAAVAPWFVWHPIIATICVVLVVATIVTERARWRWLLRS